MGNHNPRLHTDEVLEALSICAVTSDVAKKALQEAHSLKGCEAHSSVILSRVDEDVFRKLGVNITFEPKYQTQLKIKAHSVEWALLYVENCRFLYNLYKFERKYFITILEN